MLVEKVRVENLTRNNFCTWEDNIKLDWRIRIFPVETEGNHENVS
jgi:hypothetical protein